MITGSHGFVGSRAMEKYRNAVAVPSELVRNPGDALADAVREYCPDIILNAAAISDIGVCQRDPESSYIANVTLPVVLARVSKEIGAKLVSFSSDQVYTGCTDKGPYAEDTPLPTPTNIYACHKIEAECRVLDIAPDAIQLRASWMYDMPVFGHANRGNFLINVIDALMRREKMSFSDSDFRGITYVRQVVDLLDDVFLMPGGVYNYGSENTLSMYGTALALISALGFDELADEYVERSDSVHHNLWMDCTKLRTNGTAFDYTAEGFKRCAKDYSLLR